MGTHLEVEVKILNVDVKRVESVLKDQGAIIIFDGELEEWRYKCSGGGNRFRVRKETGTRERILITKKRSVASSKEVQKELEEEFAVQSVQEGQQLAIQEGYVFHAHTTKHRKEYELDNMHFCFDTGHTKIGDVPTYLEVESDNEEDVKTWVEKLGFTMEQTTTKGATSILRAFENEHS